MFFMAVGLNMRSLSRNGNPVLYFLGLISLPACESCSLVPVVLQSVDFRRIRGEKYGHYFCFYCTKGRQHNGKLNPGQKQLHRTANTHNVGSLQASAQTAC